jgi:hypothetical protein
MGDSEADEKRYGPLDETDILRNGEIIVAALDAARKQMPDEADAGSALAFAVAVRVSPEGIEDFISSLRTFSNARRGATI